ncbi:MAG: RNA-binding transcriptional accessory protein [Tindallia sp. MSAO_Bac2]|nr:MAG: RNA-binding transcriptional accessory protein [Tindallia sp. MSAO_Bac2]
MDLTKQLSGEFNLKTGQVSQILALLEEGNTIPFIARYRKEMTGGLSDEVLRDFYERLTYLQNLEQRREEVHRLITGLEEMTPELEEKLAKAKTLQDIEDIYRPFRPKRRTRATVAREKGLEPLAEWLVSETIPGIAPLEEAEKHLNPEQEINTAEEALQGAMDIVAEDLSDDADLRKKLRRLLWQNADFVTKAKDPEAETVYEMYYDYSEPAKKIPDHRILAANRGEKEEILKVQLTAPEQEMVVQLEKSLHHSEKDPRNATFEAIASDTWKRLLQPSLEREIRSELTERAETAAIQLFGKNLNGLLMQPPVTGQRVLGIDPAYRTGCKLAVVDETGKLLDTATIFPVPPQNEFVKSAEVIREFVKKHHVTAVAIGNGTGSRETEQFIASLIPDFPHQVAYVIVSEAGASVYSASKLATKEFPELDVSLRGAVSIARRLQDPLAELVKIEPKAIGVGQYQHDVNQKQLGERLSGVVEDCVNRVGVDVNTASPSLLQYVAGISKAVAENMVAYRNEIGGFQQRKQLLKVPRLGPAAYQQCAGFMRIRDGKNPLEQTGVHPESYEAAGSLLEKTGLSLKDLTGEGHTLLEEKLTGLNLKSLSDELEIGLPTLQDMVKELKKPGRDPREELPKPVFRTDVMKMEDLEPDMELTGTVRNVIDFGAFVDIGVKQDGLVHISQLRNGFVKHPLDVVSVGDVVRVKVLNVDVKKQRIGLTMKGVSQD